jgi:hypothetical protein
VGRIGRLHDSGIVLHRLDFDRLAAADGSIGIGDLSSGSVVGDVRLDARTRPSVRPRVVVADEQQASPRHAVTGTRALAMPPYLRKPQCRPRSAPRRRDDVDLDDVRNRVRTMLGADEQQLINCAAPLSARCSTCSRWHLPHC